MAEGASKTKTNKLNIYGAFDQIHVINFPATHPSLVLVLRIGCNLTEYGQEKPLKIALVGPKGGREAELGTVVGTIKAEPHTEPYSSYDHILPIENLKLEEPGEYAFHILISNETKRIIPLKVVKVTKEQMEAMVRREYSD